jgi:hypothetical protein
MADRVRSGLLGWARDRDLFFDDDLSYPHEFEHVTLARVLVARYKNDPDDSIHKATGSWSASCRQRIERATMNLLRISPGPL